MYPTRDQNIRWAPGEKDEPTAWSDRSSGMWDEIGNTTTLYKNERKPPCLKAYFHPLQPIIKCQKKQETCGILLYQVNYLLA